MSNILRGAKAFQSTAYHEAGHAVTGIVQGLGCGPVTIVPDDNGEALGSASVANPLVGWVRGDGPRRPLLEVFVMMLYAGSVASSIQSGNGLEIDGGDFSKARHWIANTVGVPGCSFVGDDAFERYELRLEKRA